MNRRFIPPARSDTVVTLPQKFDAVVWVELTSPNHWVG